MSSGRERYRVTQTLQTLHISICDLSATTFNVTIVELITIIVIRNALGTFVSGQLDPLREDIHQQFHGTKTT